MNLELLSPPVLVAIRKIFIGRPLIGTNFDSLELSPKGQEGKESGLGKPVGGIWERN